MITNNAKTKSLWLRGSCDMSSLLNDPSSLMRLLILLLTIFMVTRNLYTDELLNFNLNNINFNYLDNPYPTMNNYNALNQNQNNQMVLSGIAIPTGRAQNLPSIRHDNNKKDDERGIYGGKGDKSHLGGFTEIDMHGISPATWKYLAENWTVQSIMDVGCGRGISTSWFYTHGLRTLCVEGSHDAVTQSMIPDKSLIVEHDFSRGPWWPEQTFDAVWSVEFLEHVNIHNQYNYITTFRKAAILLVTSSHWGGWHHVEVHENDWWIRKYEAYGFRYDEKMTHELRNVAQKEGLEGTMFPPNGQPFNAQHVWTTMKVFINSAVAALPQHAHLFGEFGCYDPVKRLKGHRECGKGLADLVEVETPLDPSFYPLKLTKKQDEDWYAIVKSNIKQQG